MRRELGRTMASGGSGIKRCSAALKGPHHSAPRVHREQSRPSGAMWAHCQIQLNGRTICAVPGGRAPSIPLDPAEPALLNQLC
jgi:hypothetical protein